VAKKINIKEFEGSFSVNGNETPITHEPIDTVNADLWSMLPTQKLQEQLITLNSRLLAAQCTENMDIIRQLERGVVTLQHIINARDEDTTLI